MFYLLTITYISDNIISTRENHQEKEIIKMTDVERFEELENLLIDQCKKYESDCTACPYRKECEEYEKLYREIN